MYDKVAFLNCNSVIQYKTVIDTHAAAPINSKSRLRVKPKRCFVDPSLTAALPDPVKYYRDSDDLEIDAIGHGYKANCWCTHGCWMMASINFNPRKMISMLIKSNRETKRLSRQYPVNVDETVLRNLEQKYHIALDRLEQTELIKKGYDASSVA